MVILVKLGHAGGPTAAEKVLAFLRSQAKAPGYHGTSQKEISRGTGIRLTHVPRAVKRLRELGWVDVATGHVKGGIRQVKLYSPTESGLAKALDLLNHYGKEPFAPPPAIEVPEEEDEVVEFKEPATTLIGRDAEVDAVIDWLLMGKEEILVIYGSEGVGKSTLVTYCLEMLDLLDSSFRLRFAPETRVCDVELALSAYYKEWDGKGFPGFKRGDFVILDNIHELKEEVVEYLTNLKQAVCDSGARLIITARDSTPIYNRFWNPRAAGTVREMSIKGLDMTSTGQMLGDDIEDEALKRIYLLTKGNPAWLKFLAEGDTESLCTTRLTREEVRLLMYLRTVKGETGAKHY